MSFGNLNTLIEIGVYEKTKDKEGFVNECFIPAVKVRAYREGRHGSRRWANLAAFSEATELFRFRKIHNVNISCGNVIHCKGEFFEIISAEDVRGRGMYIEALAKKTEAV